MDSRRLAFFSVIPPSKHLQSWSVAAFLVFAQGASAGQGQDEMSPPFSSGMPDMPGGMPDMPDVTDMPGTGDAQEFGAIQDFEEMPVPAPIIDQPPSLNLPSSISEKKAVLRAELEKLSQADQRQLRLALRQVWSNPKVIAARTAYREAGQIYQQALYDAMLEQDDQVRPFLQQLVDAGLQVPFGRAVAPHVQVAKLFDVPEHLLAPHQEAISDAFARASQYPEVIECRMNLRRATMEQRTDLDQKFRNALRSALLDALPSIHDWIAETGELSA